MMSRAESDAIPYPQHPSDCDFTIGEWTSSEGQKFYGIIWYDERGGSTWGWIDAAAALCRARNIAILEDIARQERKANP